MTFGRQIIVAAVLGTMLVPGHWCCLFAAMSGGDGEANSCCAQSQALTRLVKPSCPHCTASPEFPGHVPVQSSADKPQLPESASCCQAAPPAIVRSTARLDAPTKLYFAWPSMPVDVPFFTAVKAVSSDPIRPAYLVDFEVRLCRWRC